MSHYAIESRPCAGSADWLVDARFSANGDSDAATRLEAYVNAEPHVARRLVRWTDPHTIRVVREHEA